MNEPVSGVVRVSGVVDYEGGPEKSPGEDVTFVNGTERVDRMLAEPDDAEDIRIRQEMDRADEGQLVTGADRIRSWPTWAETKAKAAQIRANQDHQK